MATQISHITNPYKYSFSGVDTFNICWYSLYLNGEVFNSSPVEIDSLTTISINVHETKSPVRSLGYRAPKGFTGAQRTIAGTMILTVIDNHPLKSLMEEYVTFHDKFDSWYYSLDRDRDGRGITTNGVFTNFTNAMPTVLPPFNMALGALTELANIERNGDDVTGDIVETFSPYSKMMLFGVEFIDDSLVLSVNNPMTEITLSFIAQDYAVINTSGLEKSSLAGFDTHSIPQVFVNDPAIEAQQIQQQASTNEASSGIENVTDDTGQVTAIRTKSASF